MLKNLVNWGDSCKLRFNSEKTEVVLFTRKRKIPNNLLRFENKTLEFSESVKYLGVTLDSRLHWREHIENKISSAKRLIMGLSNITHKASGPCPKLMKWAYEGIVKPMLTYGALVWAHELNTDCLIKKLRKVNRLAINTLCLVPRSTPTRLLEVMLDIMPLHIYCKFIAMSSYYRQYNSLVLGWAGTYKNKTYSTSHIKFWMNLKEKVGIDTKLSLIHI